MQSQGSNPGPSNAHTLNCHTKQAHWESQGCGIEKGLQPGVRHEVRGGAGCRTLPRTDPEEAVRGRQRDESYSAHPTHPTPP